MDGGSDDIGVSSTRRPWTLWAALAVAALLFGGLVYGVLHPASKPPREGLMQYGVGAMAKLVVLPETRAQPAETLYDARGAPTSLAAMRGKVILVNFWATWCAPCREEMPTLAALERHFAGRGFAVVPIAINTAQEAASARQMLAELTGDQLPFLIEPARRIPISAGVEGFPTSILYDRNGVEIARLAGAADWASPEAIALIDAALAQRS